MGGDYHQLPLTYGIGFAHWPRKLGEPIPPQSLALSGAGGLSWCKAGGLLRCKGSTRVHNFDTSNTCSVAFLCAAGKIHEYTGDLCRGTCYECLLSPAMRLDPFCGRRRAVEAVVTGRGSLQPSVRQVKLQVLQVGISPI